LRRPSAAAAAVIALAVLLCAAYALLFPIFQNPDENNHYDYALTLRTAERPIRPSEGPGQDNSHPSVRFLLQRTGGRGLRMDPLAKVPAGYGSRAFYDAIDRSAPHIDVHRFREGPLSPVPYLAKSYPLGYYGLAALAVAAGERVWGDGIVEQFFAARALSVLLFLATLIFAWLLFGELNVPAPTALILLAFTAFLPMALQTFASVQPDDLVAALIAATLWLSLLALRRGLPAPMVLIVSVLLAALCATKRHYWLAVSLPVAFAFIATGSARSRIARAALLAVPSLAAYLLTQPFLAAPPGGPMLCGPGAAPAPTPWLAGAADFFDSALLGGHSLRRFWLAFGWGGEGGGHPIVVVNRSFTEFIFALMTAGTVAIFLLFLVVLGRNLRRLVRIAGHRSAAAALALASRNVALNAYLCYALILLIVIPSLGGAILLQARYWLPFLPVIWYSAIVLVPRALTPRWALPARTIAIVGIAAVIAAGNAFAPASIAGEYFRGAPDRAARASEEVYAVFKSPAGSTRLLAPDPVAAGTAVMLRGIVVDLRNAAPASAIALQIDGSRSVPATVRRVPTFACNSVALALLDTGFDAQLPTAGLAPGRHEARVRVRTPWSRDWIDTGTSAVFQIER
jgi:hypothetical protein